MSDSQINYVRMYEVESFKYIHTTVSPVHKKHLCFVRPFVRVAVSDALLGVFSSLGRYRLERFSFVRVLDHHRSSRNNKKRRTAGKKVGRKRAVCFAPFQGAKGGQPDGKQTKTKRIQKNMLKASV